MIDMHVHLDLYKNMFGVSKIVNSKNIFTLAVTTSPKAWLYEKDFLQNYKNIKVAIGLHPEIVAKKSNEIDLLIEGIAKTKFVGEIGLDFSRQYTKFFMVQKKIFEAVLSESSLLGGRILSIHSRNSISVVLEYIKKYPNCGIPILHWFSGGIAELKEAIKLGCYFSINPIMLKSKKGKEIFLSIPKECILLESDGPFAKLNGKEIFPWDVIKFFPSIDKILLRNNLNRLLTTVF